MKTKVVQANFENIDFAENAFQNIRRETCLTEYSMTLLNQRHVQKQKVFLPIRSSANIDFEEQMHSNLLPIIETANLTCSGECQLNLTVPFYDAKAVLGKLYNLHGYHVTIS